MDKSVNENETTGAPSGLDVGLEHRFWVWWKESGWKGNADADAAFEAWMEAAKEEREACAKVCEELDRQYVAFASSAKECADRIRMRSNME